MRSLGVLCLFSLAICFALLQNASCNYQCYTCIGTDSGLSRDELPPLPPTISFTNTCSDASDLSKLGKAECSGIKKVCGKYIVSYGEYKIYMRGCMEPSDCERIPKGNECQICSEDYCNTF